MEKYFRIILLTGILMLSVCGCSVKWEEDNTEAPSDFLQDEAVIQEPETSGSQTDISQYDYLKEATLETELGTGIVQGLNLQSELTVVLPVDGTENISKNKLEANNMGVYLNVELNPKIRSGQEQYPVYENLRSLVDAAYDGVSVMFFKDINIFGIEDISNDSARAAVSYIGTGSSGLSVCDATYYLINLNEHLTVLVNVDIHYDEVTEETDRLIAELEDFYDIDIRFEQEEAQDKLDAYFDNILINPQTVSYGPMKFELPENWQKDRDYSYDDFAAYAPDGSGDRAGCGILAAQFNYEFSSDKSVYYEFEELINQLIANSYGSILSQVDITDAGETFLGDSVKVNFNFTVGGIKQEYVAYYGLRKNEVNMIAAYYRNYPKEDPTVILEYIIETGRYK